MSNSKYNGSIKTILNNLFGDRPNKKNKIMFTADEKELDFYELEDSATPKVGDKANYDGQPAEGEFTMANGETYVFSAGELTEIKEADSGGDATVEEVKEEVQEIKEVLVEVLEKLEPEIQALKKENQRLNAAIAKLKNASTDSKASNHNRATDTQDSTKTLASQAIKNLKESKLNKKSK